MDLIREDYDVALRVGRPKEGELIIRRVAVLAIILVASPSYWVASPSFLGRWGMPHSVEALSALPFARYSMNGELSPLVLDDGFRFSPSGRISCDSGAALVHAARQGLGVAFLLRYLVADELRRGELVQLAPEISLPKGDFNALHAFGRSAPPRVQFFLDYMAREAALLADM